MNIAAYKLHWTEPRVEPLVMTADEILDFLSEYAVGITIVDPTPTRPPLCSLVCEELGTVRAPTLRKAVCLAAAQMEELNS